MDVWDFPLLSSGERAHFPVDTCIREIEDIARMEFRGRVKSDGCHFGRTRLRQREGESMFILAHHISVTLFGHELEPHGLVQHCIAFSLSGVALVLMGVGAYTLSRAALRRIAGSPLKKSQA